MVTNMYRMFYVRSARAWPPSLHADTAPPCAPLAPPLPQALPPPGPHLAHMRSPPSGSAQSAPAFNQPLSSFGTSKVTTMAEMFKVRSARALTPKP